MRHGRFFFPKAGGQTDHENTHSLAVSLTDPDVLATIFQQVRCTHVWRRPCVDGFIGVR